MFPPSRRKIGATHHPVELDKILEAQRPGKSSVWRKGLGGDDVKEEEGEAGLLLFELERILS